MDAPARKTITIKHACTAYDLGRIKIWELMKTGRIKTTTAGRRRLVIVASLERYLGLDQR